MSKSSAFAHLTLSGGDKQPKPVESTGQESKDQLLSGGNSIDLSDSTDLIAAGTTASIDMDTSKLEAKAPSKASSLVRDANRREQRMVIPNAEQVRKVCDALDETIGDAAESETFDLPLIRDYVARLMVTLKSNPEFMEVIIDSDVRNIIKFIRMTRYEAIEKRDSAGVKREKKVVKSKATGKALAAASKLLAKLDSGDLEL